MQYKLLDRLKRIQYVAIPQALPANIACDHYCDLKLHKGGHSGKRLSIQRIGLLQVALSLKS